MSSSAPPVHRPASGPLTATTTSAALGVLAGLALVGLGLAAALRPSLADDGGWWFASAGVAALLFVGALLGLRAAVADVPVARRAVGAAAALLTLFGIAHFYALVDQDTAILLFSVFMVAGSVALVVAGVAVARAWEGPGRLAPLLCGVWPIATIPAGAAIGDLLHFLAIAVWGALWTVLGLTLLRPPRSARSARSPR